MYSVYMKMLCYDTDVVYVFLKEGNMEIPVEIFNDVILRKKTI